MYLKDLKIKLKLVKYKKEKEKITYLILKKLELNKMKNKSLLIQEIIAIFINNLIYFVLTNFYFSI